MAQSNSVAGAVPTLVGTALDRRLVVEWIFRIAVAMEFVGHGAFGLMTKAAWVPYFAVAGIPEPWAWRLMPVVGALDVTLGLVLLVVPLRIVLLHMACWGLMTATLRPLAGEGIWEMLERGYNYGVPLAFLFMVGVSAPVRAWIRRVEVQITPARCRAAAVTLRVAIGVSLIGHGGIALFTHERWAAHWTILGLAPDHAVGVLHGAAWLEVALGLAVLIAPVTALLVFVCVWKLATEALRIPAGEPLWEVVERGGAYAAPVLLILLQPVRSSRAAGA
jgi:hypothetical protein